MPVSMDKRRGPTARRGGNRGNAPARNALAQETQIMPSGTVKWFNEVKGFGFLTTDDGTDIFVHYSSIQGEGFKTLTEGDKVDFEISDTPKGPQAMNVKRQAG